MATWRAVILAAGRSSRMRSRLPKALHPLCGAPLLSHVVKATHGAGIIRPLVVAPQQSAPFQEFLAETDCVVQQTPRGTGDAVLAARPVLDGASGYVLVLNGDLPLLTSETLRSLMERHQASSAALTLLTAEEAPQSELGRIVRDAAGRITEIVEAHEASPQEQGIREVNGGVYAFRSEGLWPHLEALQPSSSGEVYLTDVVALAVQADEHVDAVSVEDPTELLGVNNRVHLAQAEAVLRQRLRSHWMLAGVTLVDPRSTFIDADVEIGQDTVVYPNTHLYGTTRVGRGCSLGPNTIIANSVIGEECRIVASMLEGATLEEGVNVGPYSHLRPGSHAEQDVRVGNYVEVKESRLGRGTRVGHFSYIGDATVGQGVNVGAGTVTCNFDGQAKHRTIIEDGALIGSDTMLVAPVRVGQRAVTGAGAVVTRDVDPETLVTGVPARQRSKRQRPERQSATLATEE